MSDRTASEIITAAYRKGGIKSPTTQQLTDGLEDLQNMLSSWSAEGLVVPYYTIEQFALVIGQNGYTIGSGGDFNTVRPLRLEGAFIRIDNDDYFIDFMTKEQYNRLVSKDTQARPTKMYYDPQYPLGQIKFNYDADDTYDLRLISEKPLVNPTATSTTFSVPLYINRAMVFNLAVEIAPDDDNQLPREVFVIAEESKDTLKRMHSVEKLNDNLKLDSAILGGYRYWGKFMDINAGE